MDLSPIGGDRDDASQVEHHMRNSVDPHEGRLIVRQVVKVQDITQGEAVIQWLQEQGGERFFTREATAVHSKTYLYWEERNAINILELWVGFYDDNFAMMFKLAFGAGTHAG